MTDQQPDLEAELASLQPPPLSPKCLRTIDQALSSVAPTSWRLPPRRPLAVAALAAACFLVAVTIYWSVRSGHSRPRIAAPAPTREAAPGQPMATLAVYRQAIARGPGALDALLDREAAVSRRTRPDKSLPRAGLVPDPELVN